MIFHSQFQMWPVVPSAHVSPDARAGAPSTAARRAGDVYGCAGVAPVLACGFCAPLPCWTRDAGLETWNQKCHRSVFYAFAQYSFLRFLVTGVNSAFCSNVVDRCGWRVQALQQCSVVCARPLGRSGPCGRSCAFFEYIYNNKKKKNRQQAETTLTYRIYI